MVGVDVYFCRSGCQVTDSIQEVADITLAEYKQSAHCWVIPADSAALTPEPRPMENDLRNSLSREREPIIKILAAFDLVAGKEAGCGPCSYRSC